MTRTTDTPTDTDFTGVEIDGADTTTNTEVNTDNLDDTPFEGDLFSPIEDDPRYNTPNDTTDTNSTTTTDTDDLEGIHTGDVWVDTEYNRARVELIGETYPAKDTIKFDWHTTHHAWNGDDPDRKPAWVVDADALPELKEKLEDAGHEVHF